MTDHPSGAVSNDQAATAAHDTPSTPEHPEPGPPTGAPPAGQAPPLPAATANRYCLLDEIARGGMGVIYRARDTILEREIAVKVLQDRFDEGSGVARRFLDEARITGQLQHPGIPAVHDLGTLPDGRPFLAMKLVKGQTLDDLLKQRPSPAEDRGRFVAVFEQICQAVGYAHAHQVLHRDLKPANVMVGSFGEVQVMDWGLAKVLGSRTAGTARDPEETTGTAIRSLRDSDGSETQAGSVLGTPAFMPPEQAIGAVHQIDERSDVFGLGAILAVILSGQPPFVGDTAEDVRVLAARGKVDACFTRLDACGADPDLVALCKKCLAPEPAERMSNAGAVAKAVAELRAAADERRQAEINQQRAAIQGAEQRKRRRVTFVAAAGLVAVLLAGVVGTGLGLLEARRQSANERQARLEAEDNFQKAVRSAELVSDELARGIRPIAGTQSKTVVEILARTEAVYDDLLNVPNPPARVRLSKAKMLILCSDVYREMNQLHPAIERATQAIELCRGLLAEGPTGPQYPALLATALHSRASAVAEMGAWSKALADYHEAILLFEAAGTNAEQSPGDALLLAACQTASANGYVDFGDLATAGPLYERGLATREYLYRKFPDDPRYANSLATSCERYSRYFFAKNERNQGLEKLRRAVELNAAAFAVDRANQLRAFQYAESLGSLAQEELADDRAAALTHLKQAEELARTFASRDPENNNWKRADLRAKWLASEYEKANWLWLPLDQREEAQATQTRLLGEMLAVTDKALAETPDGGTWLSDRGNFLYRLAQQRLALADTDLDREASLRRALDLADQSVAVYRRVLAIEPKSHARKAGLHYAMWVGSQAAAKIRPDGEALRRHWQYCLAETKHYVDLAARYPGNPAGLRNLQRVLVALGTVPTDLADTWVAVTVADPGLVSLFLEMCEAAPDPAALADADLADQAVVVRARLALRLDTLARATSLGERGDAVRTRLRPGNDPRAAQFDRALAAELLQQGSSRRSRGDLKGAIASYDAALKVAPNDAAIHNALAWLLATTPNGQYRDGKQAVEHATRACTLTEGKNAAYLATLAAAHAEAGDFDKAIEFQKKALAAPDGPKSSRAPWQARLEQFTRKIAYRDVPRPAVLPPAALEGRYDAILPGTPIRSTQLIPVNTDLAISTTTDSIFAGTCHYEVEFTEFPPGLLNPQDSTLLVRIGETLLGTTRQMLSERCGVFGPQKYPLREITFTLDGKFGRNRLILAGNRLYGITLLAPSEQELSNPDATKLYDSFTLTPPVKGPVDQRVRQADALAEALLADKVTATPAPEICRVAVWCKFNERFVDAVRLFEKAFAAEPKLADDLGWEYRYGAACYAARAARGDGARAPDDREERAALRKQALTWLQADLALWKERAGAPERKERALAARTLAHWQRDPDLSGVRPGPARPEMPSAEQAAWDKLWAEVRATRAAARKAP